MVKLVKPIAEWSAAIMEILGIFMIIGLAVYALAYGTTRLFKQDETRTSPFDEVRQNLGRGILLGLEFLVAADIIYTVVIDLTFKTVGVLATIVLIRTFLSFTLDVELTGRWPWQKEGQRQR